MPVCLILLLVVGPSTSFQRPILMYAKSSRDSSSVSTTGSALMDHYYFRTPDDVRLFYLYT